MPAAAQLKGQRFGRLVVQKKAFSTFPGGVHWLCRCDCKKKITVTTGHLLSKKSPTVSCGCQKLEALARNRLKIDNVIHGHAVGHKSQAYGRWCAMKSRCSDPNHAGGKSWKNYGGRGITVCKRWLNSFQNFLDDMGEPPPGTSLDRKNNNRGYYKRNCRWATKAQQIANQRSHGPQKRLSALIIASLIG
jgi:hypothetical protein